MTVGRSTLKSRACVTQTGVPFYLVSPNRPTARRPRSALLYSKKVANKPVSVHTSCRVPTSSYLCILELLTCFMKEIKIYQ
ncbi:hypothetical protein Z043_109135 [Scleropages formosus]|uniref:Uncharacterized protein n=1 Tax=Scleropages formosus TaxID=113540 RepID=A0A0N8K0E4_SCLFO|nr:hypothetical protein Z043_109135 [Scleropages formosus]